MSFEAEQQEDTMPIRLKNSTITNNSSNSIEVHYGPIAVGLTLGAEGSVTIPAGVSHTFRVTAEIQLVAILETFRGLYEDEIYSSLWSQVADTPSNALKIRFSSDNASTPRPTHLDILIPFQVNYERVTVPATKVEKEDKKTKADTKFG
jgi:hypothetical protein